MVTYGLDLMLSLFKIVQGVISTIISASGLGGTTSTTLPQTIITAVEDCGFLSLFHYGQ